MHPLRVVLRMNGIFGLAGLYECWRSAKGDIHRTCTILMTRANGLVGEYDRRMPAVLESDEIAKWLEPDLLEMEYLNRLLKPSSEERWRAYPEGTGKSGSYGMWNHPRGHVWNVFVRPASS